ncbi:MAG: sugar phosphate isomerase/epimerase [Chloroflexota bacterium]|nr:sugar phosphate isomerase/epimerase [Chloroflexota bacterium]
MRIGIDSYSYHRRYGEHRAGEAPSFHALWPLEPGPALRHARAVGADDIFLETCYLPEPEAIDAGALLAEAGPVEIGFSWGHPWPAGRFHGLDGGRSYGAEQELARWIEAAGRLDHELLRITAGSPASRGDEPAAVLVERLVGPLRRAADHAAERGVRLALENHGDLRVADILELLSRVDRPGLGVCLDNVNLIRVGDDMAEGTRALAPHTLLVQLKDHEDGDPTVWGGPVCTALGEGVADLDGLLAILAAAGFDGPVCVELASLGQTDVDELAMIERSVAWLRTNVPRQPC